MRLWSLHPRYLDPKGLVALWREGLLARAVLRGETLGYRHHPQLLRFRAHATPRRAIDSYLASVLDDSVSRGYRFDRSRIGRFHAVAPITTTQGQLEHEWRHLLGKLQLRSPRLFECWHALATPGAHPLFEVVPGPVEAWERGPPAAVYEALPPR